MYKGTLVFYSLFNLIQIKDIESEAISSVTSTYSNRCTTPVGHTDDDGISLLLEYAIIPPEVQHQVPEDIQGFPYFLVLRIVQCI